MEDIKKLVEIISNRKQRQYPLLEFKYISENLSKENIFYKHIKSGDIKSDDDASKLIYNTKSDDDRYRMLKSRLKQKLLNHMIFLDFTDNNQKSIFHFEQECIQQLHQAKMLIFTGENKIAGSLILKALATTNKYELTKHKISCFEDLIKIYSENCQPHLFGDILNDLNKARILYNKEVESRELYYFIKMMVVKSINSRKKNLKKVEDIIYTLEKNWKETNSFNIFEYLFKLTLLHKELTGDFEAIINILKEVENGKLRGKKLNIYRIDYNYIIQSMAFAYFKSWNFSDGITFIESKIDHVEKSSTNWYNLSAIYFLTSIYCKNYATSNAIINNVFANKTFEKLSDNQKDKWKLFDAYLKMINSENFYLINFQELNFAEKVPGFSKNKEGFNFALIILQFIYFLGYGQIDELVERRNILKEYMANHFKENFSYRTRTFYKLISIVVENDLNRKLIIQKSKYLIKKLLENKVISNVYVEYEIVPYEQLWDYILGSIKDYEDRSFK